MNCPKCRRKQYTVCDNLDCVCYKRVPKGKLPQVYDDADNLSCPYCGFTARFDYWGMREMKFWHTQDRIAKE